MPEALPAAASACRERLTPFQRASTVARRTLKSAARRRLGRSRNRDRRGAGGQDQGLARAVRGPLRGARVHRGRARVLPPAQGSAAAPGGTLRGQGGGLQGDWHGSLERRRL